MNLLASLRYLVALEEHRHFGRAAQACHITQPALSNAMRALEHEFGVVIIKRGRNFEGLTPEGQRVLSSAQRMLHEHHLLQQELASGADHPTGPLRMGAVPTAFPVLARFAARLQSRHPGIVPSVWSMNSSAIEAGLENLSLDLALGYTQRLAPQGSQIDVLRQYVEHYFLLRRVVALDTGQGLQVGPPLRWAEAAAMPLAMLSPDMHNRSILDAAFAAAGVVVGPALETNSILGLTVAVLAGNVCSVLPGALVAEVRNQPGLLALPLEEPEVLTPIGFMTRANAQPSRALAAALDFAKGAEWMTELPVHAALPVAPYRAAAPVQRSHAPKRAARRPSD